MKSYTLVCIFALAFAAALGQYESTSLTPPNPYESTTPEDIYGKRTTPKLTSTTERGIYGHKTSTKGIYETSTPAYPSKSSTPLYGERSTTEHSTPLYGEKSTTEHSTPIYGEKSTTEHSTPIYGEKSTTPKYGELESTVPSSTPRDYEWTSTEGSSTPVYGTKSTTDASSTPYYGDVSTTKKVYSDKSTTIPAYSRVTPRYLDDIKCPNKKLVIRCHEKDVQNLVKFSIVENFNGFKNSTPEDSLKFIKDVSGIYDVLHDELHWTAPETYSYPILLRSIINREKCPSPVIRYLRWETVNEERVNLKIDNKWFAYDNPNPSTPFTVIFPEEKRTDRFSIFLDKVEGNEKGGIGKLELVVCCETN